MRKRVCIIGLVVIFAMLLTMAAVACNGKPDPKPQAGIGLSVSFLKDFTFDLDGVVSLGIEKRPVKKKVSKMVAYADDEEEKNYLVGETEDREVIKIMLLNKLGEAYSQDELPAQFNKLCVSGNFIFFELIPADVYDNISEYGAYYFYSPEDLDDNGNPIEGATPNVAYISLRENQAEEDLEEFEKSSVPNDVVGAFVYSMENEKIYDLSETGYEVIGNGVVSMSGAVYRVSINEDNELVTTPAFNDYHAKIVQDVKVDKYGNIFAKSNTCFIEEENKVYVENAESWESDVFYVMNEELQAVQLNSNGTVMWIDENGLRELREEDNYEQNKVYLNGFFWEGIKNGIAKYYLTSPVWIFDKWPEEIQLQNTDYNFFMLQPHIAVGVESRPTTTAGRRGVWFSLIHLELGLNTFIDDFYREYPNAKQNIYGGNPNAFIVTTSQGETTYEFYWDEEEETVKIRTVEEITSKPIEVKKFQPIT